MSNAIDIKVPDIGDFKDVPVIEIFVKVGDTVKAEDPLISLESDKATMDVPAPLSGTVKELKLGIGDKVSEGTVILSLATGDAGAAGAPAAPASPVARLRITVPSLTLSPMPSFSSLTVPDSGAGTSIVALSDSSEISGSSAFTVSPTLTKISMTGTSLKSPMSGTLMSMALLMDDPQTVQGAARSVSSPYLAMASATTAGFITPSSASALRAATVTCQRSTSKKRRRLRR